MEEQNELSEELEQALDLDEDELVEVINALELGETDVEVGRYRFIASSVIDELLAEELGSDLYVLGCFRASFIAEQTDLPVEMIEACQEVEAFESIGQGILATCGIESFAKAYSDIDGYGHHFATYDGDEIELTDYYAFRIN